MSGSAPDPSDRHAEAARVGADLADIEARLRAAQEALDQAARERQAALDRLEKLHEERMAQQADRDAMDRLEQLYDDRDAEDEDEDDDGPGTVSR